MEFYFYVILRANNHSFYLDHSGTNVFWTNDIKEAEKFENKIDADNIANYIGGYVKSVKCTLS